MHGSGRKINSISSAGAGFGAGRLAGLNFSVTLRGVDAEPATTPSFSVLRQNFSNPPGEFEKFWRKTLNDGVVAGSASTPLNVTLKFNPASLPAPKPAPADEIEFIFRPDPCIYDGRFANNGWLQELPKPV